MSERRLSPSLARNPDLDDWVRIEPDGTVVLSTGKVEIGQGIRTAIARIGADELDVSLERVRVNSADTAAGPDEFLTAGSGSVEQSGSAMRQAAAEARQVLLEMAAQHLGAPLASLEVVDGVVRVRGGGRSIGYGALMGGRRFERKVSGEARPKAPGEHRIVGRPGPRIDLLPKLTGGAFVHDMRLPGMLFGRVLRPPSPAAELLEVDEGAIRRLPGVVAIVRDGRFLGVLAEREEQAVQAWERLREASRWREEESLPPEEDLFDWLAAQPGVDLPVVEGMPVEQPVAPHVPPEGAARTLIATYERPYQMHASIGPSAAVALFEGDHLTVWSHSQGISLLRPALARVLGLPPERVRVIHADGPGGYGHNGADDAALDAALLARAVPGRPLRLQWMREDEHAWEPYGPAMRMSLGGSLDAAGRVVDWSHEVWSQTHVARPMPWDEGSQLLAAWHLAEPLPAPEPRPFLRPHAGIHRNADPLYSFPRRRVVKRLRKSRLLRTSALRSLGAFANVFAIEAFLDELAAAAGADPLAFRLRHLEDPRARAVLEAAAERAGWRSAGGSGRGQGMAFARYENAKAYAAVVVDLEVDAVSGAIHLERAVVAADAGQVVDPEGLANQLEGGLVQAASWTLFEAVRFDRTRVRSLDWESYPILGFLDVPQVEVVLLDRPEEPFLGAGEAAQGPTPAAIANAVFHATGLRLRRIPFTPERVRQAGRG